MSDSTIHAITIRRAMPPNVRRLVLTSHAVIGNDQEADGWQHKDEIDDPLTKDPRRQALGAVRLSVISMLD